MQTVLRIISQAVVQTVGTSLQSGAFHRRKDVDKWQSKFSGELAHALRILFGSISLPDGWNDRRRTDQDDCRLWVSSLDVGNNDLEIRSVQIRRYVLLAARICTVVCTKPDEH